MNCQRMSLLSLDGRRRSERGVGQGPNLEKQIRFEKTCVKLDYCGSR